MPFSQRLGLGQASQPLANVVAFKFRALALWHEQQRPQQKPKIYQYHVFEQWKRQGDKKFAEHIGAGLVSCATKVLLP